MDQRLSAPGRLSLLSRRVPRLSRVLSRLHARVYRATGGRGVGRWFGVPLAVIETVGRRSGKLRRTPVIYVEHGDDVLVMAANGGSDRTPAWWLNMRAAGRGTLILHGRAREVVAREAGGVEREELWRVFAGAYPAVDEYVTFTERELPLVVLSRAGGSGAPVSASAGDGSAVGG
jgi:deazaflavin-dependent oxidoreductase (nitroreductase family)